MSNKDLIEGVTTSKVNVSVIVNDLTSTATDKPISANQGKVLNDLITALTTSVGDKVDKVSGKGLSTNDFTTTDKDKLNGIATGANVNVQADWNVTDNNSDAYIKNKPTSMPASDVYDWAKSETKPEYSKSEVGLDNVPNVSTNDQTPTFTETTTRTNIASGEKLSVIFGKIMKWFTDLKDVAFSGSYNDLTDKPTIPTKTSELTNDSGYKTTEYGVVSKTANGLVPQLPNETTTTKYLRQDGTWEVPPDTNTTYATATQSANGLMLSTDKKKLDGIIPGGTYTLITSGCSIPQGKSNYYARSDHTHNIPCADVHQLFSGSVFTDRTLTDAEDDGYYEWYAKFMRIHVNQQSWNQSGQLILRIFTDDKWNPGYVVYISIGASIDPYRIDNLGIDPEIFGIGILKVDDSTYDIYTACYIGTPWLGIYGDIYAEDVPSLPYEIFQYQEVDPDDTVLSSITWVYNKNHIRFSASKDLWISNIFPERQYKNDPAYIGNGDNRYNTIYLSSSPNVTSDRNFKTDIQKVSDKFLRLFDRLIPVSFQFTDGRSGRTHIGFISQDVEEAMADVGVTDIEFAGFCKDKVTKTERNTVPLLNEDGTPVLDRNQNPKMKIISKVVDDLDENGNVKYIYSLRYEEFIALNTAAIKRQQVQIDSINSRLKVIEEKM